MVVTEERKKIKKRKWELMFAGYIKQMFQDVKDTSKIHKINVNAMQIENNKDIDRRFRVIIFFLKGKYFTTREDGQILLGDFLKRNERVSYDLDKILREGTTLLKLQTLDPSFENDELRVFDVDELKESSMIKRIVNSSVVCVGVGEDDRKAIDFYNTDLINLEIIDDNISEETSIDQNNHKSSSEDKEEIDENSFVSKNFSDKDISTDENENENNNYKTMQSENYIISQKEISTHENENMNYTKNQDHNSLKIRRKYEKGLDSDDLNIFKDEKDTQFGYSHSSYKIEENAMFKDVKVSDENLDISTMKNMNSQEFNTNQLISNQPQKFQLFNNDWTNEMVDNVIGTMFDYDDKKSDYNYPNEEPECVDRDKNNEQESVYLKPEKGNQALSRPFVCHYKQCNRAFKRFEHLKRHYRIHTGERPFKCKFPGCHKAFARSDNLNQHMRVHNTGGISTNTSNQRNNLRFIDDD